MDQTTLIIPCYFLTEELIEMTADCLASLELMGRPDEVIIVDDGSPLDPGFTGTIYRETNGGYAAAVNTGLEAAHGDILIIANNDLLFTPEWLPGLLLPLQQGYGISSVRTSDNGWETEERITGREKFGSLWAMTREVYETVGPLDESFGMYFEDLDYQHRAKLAGFDAGKNHAILVEHRGKATVKQTDPDDLQVLASREKFIAKWGKTW